MWEQYKKTAKFMQAFILLACVAIYFSTGRQLMAVLIFFLVMEIGALFGAAWGARIKNRTEAAARRRGELPLERGKGV
jgi:hypothetical protein